MDQADDDWEEWDGKSPFWIHCVAGSLAGVTEHTAVYPLDTVRTHIQVCASCLHRNGAAGGVGSSNAAASAASAAVGGSKNALLASTLRKGGIHPSNLPTGMWQTMRFLVNEPTSAAAAATATLPHGPTPPSSTPVVQLRTFLKGYGRLWRGVQTILIGCIPAHALYFSSYEIVKSSTMDPKTGQVTTWGSSLAGAAAVVSHDIVMTPLDTMKQRMQLGHYQAGVSAAFRSILETEGWRALYRSFPITLATNIPYGMVMVSTHEVCKRAWSKDDRPAWQTVLMASSFAGLTASAITTPLDRVKTALQTQELAPACLMNKDITMCHRQQAAQFANVRHHSLSDAALSIYRAEGMAGFARGLLPRIMSHTPAVAISWTTYETAKHALMKHYNYCD